MKLVSSFFASVLITASVTSATPIAYSPSVWRENVYPKHHLQNYYASSDVLAHAFPSLFASESAHEMGKLLVDLVDDTHKGEKMKKRMEKDNPTVKEVAEKLNLQKESEMRKETEELKKLNEEVTAGKFNFPKIRPQEPAARR